MTTIILPEDSIITKETYLVDRILKSLQDYFKLNIFVGFYVDEVGEELRPYLFSFINDTKVKVRSITGNSITATLAEFKDFHELNFSNWQTRSVEGLFMLEHIISLQEYLELGQMFESDNSVIRWHVPVGRLVQKNNSYSTVS